MAEMMQHISMSCLGSWREGPTESVSERSFSGVLGYKALYSRLEFGRGHATQMCRPIDKHDIEVGHDFLPEVNYPLASIAKVPSEVCTLAMSASYTRALVAAVASARVLEMPSKDALQLGGEGWSHTVLTTG